MICGLASPVPHRHYDAPGALSGRGLHRRGASDPRSPLHQSRSPGLRLGQPAGDRERGAFCPLFALFRDRPAALPRGVRGRRPERRPPLRRHRGGARAAQLYERVFLGYGDDSIAQVGGAHVACEWVSNILTKVLQRGRLAAYLEQSTRYIPYDKPLPGGRRLPLLPRRGARAAVRPGDGRAVRHLLALAGAGRGLGGGALAARRRRAGGRLAALDPGQGARPAARPAARGDAEPRRHLRLRAGLRAADPAADVLAAAGGPRSTAG